MAGNLKIIKRRIKSAKNIGQITKAMEMVAASKMKRAQKKAISSKPYADKIYEVVLSLMTSTNPKLHPLLRKPIKDDNPLIILISTNRGLCGSLNLNLFRSLNRFLLEQNYKLEKIKFITLGKKGLNYIIKNGFEVLADFSDNTNFLDIIFALTSFLTKRFQTKKNTSVWLAYSDFINALKQEPKFRQILPITEILNNNQNIKIKEKVNFLIEPSAKKILSFLLPFYLETQVREAIIEAEASEYSARMLAMKNATENAQELVGGLTLEFNKLRQQEVTTEISDIVIAKISMETK